MMNSTDYIVVARRYRPQRFEELIGQEHVGRALAGAIRTGRVGHAYLFCGARGVGKTSAARILAKALNCVKGPTAEPCNECEICRDAGAGEDVDILEIDGASNRGVEEIRQLRQNVGVRPSRARYKIYIIDEVHMLTREAFNALLKTLEEPPEHVKFIFCTTEPEKVPITIHSRCQRFEFAAVATRSIVERLAQICQTEGVTAEREAIELLARRANGSMRDSQSLLEQVLSFCGERITTADVHAMLGTAGGRRMAQLVAALAQRNAAAALAELDAAIQEGVEVGQLIEQLMGHFRDTMAAAVGCPADGFLYTSSAESEEVTATGRQLGLETILAVIQILDQTLARMRQSTHARTLAEMAIVRIASLENLEELAAVVAELRQPQKKSEVGGKSEIGSRKSEGEMRSAECGVRSAEREREESSENSPSPTPHSALRTPHSNLEPLSPEAASTVWQQAIGQVSGLLADQAAHGKRVAFILPNRLVVSFPRQYSFSKITCERAEQAAKLQQAVSAAAGRPLRLEFTLLDEPAAVAPPTVATAQGVDIRRRRTEVGEHPLVRRAVELFGGEVARVEQPPAPAGG